MQGVAMDAETPKPIDPRVEAMSAAIFSPPNLGGGLLGLATTETEHSELLRVRQEAQAVRAATEKYIAETLASFDREEAPTWAKVIVARVRKCVESVPVFEEFQQRTLNTMIWLFGLGQRDRTEADEKSADSIATDTALLVVLYEVFHPAYPVFPRKTESMTRELARREFDALRLSMIRDLASWRSRLEAAASRVIDEIEPTVREPWHTADFRSVNWYGTFFEFTPSQAACVGVLWQAWENGAPVVGDAAILEATNSDSTRLSHVFRTAKGYHDAWGTMIIEGQTKGSHRLNEPPCES